MQQFVIQIEGRIAMILRADMIPWRTPWIDDPNCGFPSHAMTGAQYACVNPVLLTAASNYHRFASKWWARKSEWESLGGSVKDNQPSTLIVCYLPQIATLNVYNLDQVEGECFDKHRPLTTKSTRDDKADWSCIDRIIEAGKIDVREGGNRGLYTYPKPDGGGDFITMPPECVWPDKTHYCFTMLHEFAHWTQPRLGWPSKKDACLDELVAEMASGYATMLLNIPSDLCDYNHRRQLEAWLTSMKNPPGYFFTAARQAMRAANYLVALSQPSIVVG